MSKRKVPSLFGGHRVHCEEILNLNKKLSCRRETASCFVSLNISLSSHSRSFKMTPLN